MKRIASIIPILIGCLTDASSHAQAATATTTPLAFEVISIKRGDTTDPRLVRGGGCRGADNPNFMTGGPIVVPLAPR